MERRDVYGRFSDVTIRVFKMIFTAKMYYLTHTHTQNKFF